MNEDKIIPLSSIMNQDEDIEVLDERYRKLNFILSILLLDFLIIFTIIIIQKN